MLRRLILIIGIVLSAHIAAAEPSGPAIRVDWVGPMLRSAPSSSTIIAEDFEQTEGLRGRYLEYYDCDGGFVPDKSGGYDGSFGMKCTFAKVQVEAGNLKLVFGKNPFKRGPKQDTSFHDIYWRVYVRHEPGWEGNPAKLGRTLCMAGADWSEGLMAHVWGGKGDTLCIDPASGITDSRKVTDKYNDFAHLRWLGLRNANTPIFNAAESGRWVCVESHVKVNTPGKKDGQFALWIDGKLEASREDLDWHGTWDDYGINAVFLENYWNAGAPKRESRWFDNMVIGTEPIGPVTVSAQPVVHRTAGVCAQWQARVTDDAIIGGVLWTSTPVDGAKMNIPINSRNPLTTGRVYWMSVRQRDTDGTWSPWSTWHSPFGVGR